MFLEANQAPDRGNLSVTSSFQTHRQSLFYLVYIEKALGHIN